MQVGTTVRFVDYRGAELDGTRRLGTILRLFSNGRLLVEAGNPKDRDVVAIHSEQVEAVVLKTET